MATNVRVMISLPLADTTYTLAARLTAAGFTGLPAFRTLSYFTPGGDYSVAPNTDNVTIGNTAMDDVEDGLIMAPGVRWDEPATNGQSYYNPTEIGLRSASANQRVLIMGISMA